MQASVQFLSGVRAGETVSLTGGRTVFGRQVGDVVIDDPEASSIHAIIQYDGGSWSVMDLGSTNGIYVNNELRLQSPLEPGDRVRIGQTEMLFHLGVPPVAAAVPEAVAPAAPAPSPEFVASTQESLPVSGPPMTVPMEIDAGRTLPADGVILPAPPGHTANTTIPEDPYADQPTTQNSTPFGAGESELPMPPNLAPQVPPPQVSPPQVPPAQMSGKVPPPPPPAMVSGGHFIPSGANPVASRPGAPPLAPHAVQSSPHAAAPAGGTPLGSMPPGTPNAPQAIPPSLSSVPQSPSSLAGEIPAGGLGSGGFPPAPPNPGGYISSGQHMPPAGVGGPPPVPPPLAAPQVPPPLAAPQAPQVPPPLAAPQVPLPSQPSQPYEGVLPPVSHGNIPPPPPSRAAASVTVAGGSLPPPEFLPPQIAPVPVAGAPMGAPAVPGQGLAIPPASVPAMPPPPSGPSLPPMPGVHGDPNLPPPGGEAFQQPAPQALGAFAPQQVPGAVPAPVDAAQIPPAVGVVPGMPVPASDAAGAATMQVPIVPGPEPLSEPAEPAGPSGLRPAVEGSFEVLFEVAEGSDFGQIYRFRRNSILVGRKNADLVLHDSDVSRRQSSIEVFEGGQVFIKDLHSTNGTFVNGSRVTTYRLQNGDRVKMGRCVMRFSLNQL